MTCYRRLYCHDCDGWTYHVSSGPLAYECEECGADALCDECGGVWSDDHNCDAEDVADWQETVGATHLDS